MIDQNTRTDIQHNVTGPNLFGDIQTIIDSLPAQIGFKDESDRFLFVNKVLCEVLGKPEHELVGGGMWSDLFPRDEARDIREWDLRVIESGKPASRVHQLNVNGDRKWVRIDRSPYFDAKGNIIGTVGCAIDLTPLMQSRNALLVSCPETESRAGERTQPADRPKSELAGLLPPGSLVPICSVCKKIRDKTGHWHSLEDHINACTGTQFTHGYCPECADKALREVQPLKTVCEKCGRNLKMTRYVIGGRHFRRYSCPECGYSQEYVREKID